MTAIREPGPSLGAASEPRGDARRRSAVAEFVSFLFAGVAFGVVLTKAEVISWYRIQEMFRFQSFHMYGVLGSAMMTAFVSLQLLRRLGARSVTGEVISVPAKVFGRGHRYWIGGLIFGAGWALTGACPGPLFALVGTGSTVVVVTLLMALAGTWIYGWLRPRLPH